MKFMLDDNRGGGGRGGEVFRSTFTTTLSLLSQSSGHYFHREGSRLGIVAPLSRNTESTNVSPQPLMQLIGVSPVRTGRNVRRPRGKRPLRDRIPLNIITHEAGEAGKGIFNKLI